MFTDILFLILNLLLFAGTLDSSESLLFNEQPHLGFLCGMAIYLPFLLLIYLQSRDYSKKRTVLLCNIELLLFFFCFYFLFGAQHLLFSIFAPFGQMTALAFVLFLYFIGLFVCHFATTNSSVQAFIKIRFLLPLALPFFFFVALGDFENLIPFEVFGNSSKMVVVFLIDLIAIVSLFMFFPPVLVFLWGCPKLETRFAELTKELEEFLPKPFKLRLWNVMEGSYTAAIVGVLPRFRYILFTSALLDRFPYRLIKAVLAHEIGHSHYRHLLLYPWILLGMIVFAYDLEILFYPVLFGFQDLVVQVVLSLLFILSAAFYFRFVFGYFSRLFERQADLYVYNLGVPAEDMIDALNLLGTLSGNSHDVPSWHHYSIRERIEFLKRTMQNPALVNKHHRRVRHSLMIYSCILMLFFTYFIF
ncbi:MAG: M48 family metallopeptidase [Parachlamydiaceae bacterium]